MPAPIISSSKLRQYSSSKISSFIPPERAAKLAAMKNKAGKSKAKAEALRKAKEEKAKELKKEKKEKAKEEQEAKNPDQKKRGGRL
mgnify:CR=1 FL=1